MTTGGGDLECSPGALLAADVREIEIGRLRGVAVLRDVRLGIRHATHVGGRLREMANRDRLDAGQRGLRRRRGRAQQTHEARPSRRLGHGEHAADRSQPPVEAELADRRVSS